MRPRIRSIKPEMRQDERYARLSYPARELFNGMITMADDEGRFRALSSAILGHVFPYDDDAPRKLRGWVSEIKESGMVVFYVAEAIPYGAFRHWARHQKINRPSPSDLPPPPDGDVVMENGLVKTTTGWKQSHGSNLLHSLNAHGESRECSVSVHDLIIEASRSVHSSPRGRAFRSDLDPVRLVLDNGQELTELQRIGLLSHLLAAHVHANDPKVNPDPEHETWLRDMRLLVADRDGDIDEVRRIIEWCQADGFWRSNILSPGKLRKQFTQLLLRSAPVVTPLRRESPSDLLRGLNGGAA